MLGLGGALFALAGGPSTGWSQNPLTRALVASKPTNSTAETRTLGAAGESPADRLAKVRAELAGLKGPEDGSVTNQTGFSLRRSLLQWLARLYEQQISYVAELETLKNSRAEITREARAWTGFAEPRPYSILLVDRLREAIQVERQEAANGEAALSILEQLTEEHRATLKEAEENIRRLNEQLESGTDTGERAQQREIERLRSQSTGATVAVLDFERQIRQERLAISRVRLELLQRQIVLADAGAAFSDADLQKVLGLIEADERQAERELAEAVTRRGAALKALDAATEALRKIQAEANADASAVAQAQELVEVRRTQLETVDVALSVLRFLLQAGIIERTMWEARFASSSSSRSAEKIRWGEQRLDQFRGRLELWRSYYGNQWKGAASQVTFQAERLASMDASSALAPLVRERLAALRERDQFLLRIVRQIERGDRLLQRWAEGLREAADDLPFGARVRNAMSGTQSWLSRLWNLEFFVVQDTVVVEGQPITGKRGVTLGKIISAILILVVGYWLTGLISRVSEPIVIKRFKIDANQANLIRRWVRVALVFSLALFSLALVKIPLTVFAFAGGALVIGLGFGMQTILKNFVSGIIILFERPFRVGDVLDVAGQRGTVSGVGIRSSVLQQWDGTETLIPNSALLENSVTNWTYSNRKVRFIVRVGVAYGSDTRRVVQLLTEVAERHGLVEKNPQPQILFVNFGDSAFMFELRFWVDVISANAAQVCSDLRQMIAGTFAENKIVIAFPQRDLHVDSVRPLQVQVLPLADAGNGETRPQPSAQPAKLENPTPTPEPKPAIKIP